MRRTLLSADLASLAAPAERGTPLPRALRDELGALAGADLDTIRVHVTELAARLGVRAFACGERLWFAPDAYRPDTEAGRWLVAHEVAHVLQQRARAASDAGAARVGAWHEAEADAFADRVLAGLGLSSDAPPLRLSPAPLAVQGCKDCNNNQCAYGELCRYEGLYHSANTPPHVAPHKETKQYSQRGVQESEHMVPKAALKHSGVSFSYNDEPTISIPYEVHRGGVSGSGGGVTSTGSSAIAAEWSKRIGLLIKGGDWKTAIWQCAIDEINSAAMQKGVLTDAYAVAVCAAVDLHAQMGRITADDAGEIKTAVYNAYMNWAARKW